MENDTLMVSESRDSIYLQSNSFDAPLYPDALATGLKDTLRTQMTAPNFPQHLIPKTPLINDIVFCLFIFCFCFFGIFIGRKIKGIPTLLKDFFTIKDRESLFSTTTDNEWYERLFLGIQTCLLFSIFALKYFSSNSEILASLSKTAVFLFAAMVVIILFFIFKWLLYSIVNYVFFNKTGSRILINNYTSLIAFLGVILFIPVLLYYNVSSSQNICFYIILFCFILTEILLIFKSFVLFFRGFDSFLYFILYLCALEITPLFFLWESIIHLFNLVEKSTL